MAKTTKSKSLVIVESPAKAKTINKYLGPDFEVKASMGHVRDLPSKGMNIDIENNFEPTYEISPGKAKVVSALKAEAKTCGRFYLATDMDREGEAIAWHLKEVLGLDERNTYRVVFNAITKKDIDRAFADPGKIDMDRVLAQQARRVLDRIVGYQISPLLWKKVARGLSAGRVQSVAVKLVVERERQIRAFDPEEYWLIPAIFADPSSKAGPEEWQRFLEGAKDKDKGRTLAEQDKWLSKHSAFRADLETVGGKKFEAANESDARQVFESIREADFVVKSIQTKRSQTRAAAPFITSTLQQAAANRLGFAAKKTMMIAQQLYEGIDLGSMGTLGLITYMRTDSTHLSEEAIADARRFIHSQIGPAYLPAKPNFYAARKDAQQAHEAIRPTDADLTPDELAPFLTDDQYKLYDLIWRRFVACQMNEAQWDTTKVQIEAAAACGPCVYSASGRVQIFDGFTRIWSSGQEEPTLPELTEGQSLRILDLRPVQHFTKPPARYTEAALIKALEKEGIGRPSTYASIISTIQDRKYVEKINRAFHATDVGEVVTDKLEQYFPHIMDVAFTRHMEEQLDKIEEQHLNWVEVLHEFYGPFKESLEKAAEEMKHAKAETQPSEYTCPDCKAPLEYRFGKNGKFLSCTKYPDCKFACPCDKEGRMIQSEESELKCPNCGKPLIRKMGRFGPFLGCSAYPECKTILKVDKEGNPLPPAPPPTPTGVRCHKCKDGQLVIRQSKRGPFMGCNRFPKCRTIVSMKMLDKLKDLQEKGKWPPESLEKADEILERKSAAAGPRKRTLKKKAAQ